MSGKSTAKAGRFKAKRKTFYGVGCEAAAEKWLEEMAEDGWVLVASSPTGAATLFIFEKQ